MNIWFGIGCVMFGVGIGMLVVSLCVAGRDER